MQIDRIGAEASSVPELSRIAAREPGTKRERMRVPVPRASASARPSEGLAPA
jgi:hypothetical protein